MGSVPSVYPWDALRVIPRRTVVAARRLLPQVRRAIALDDLSAALTSTIPASVEIAVRRIDPAPEPPDGDRSVFLATADGSVVLWLEPEAALASALLAKIFQRQPSLVGADAALTAPARGALAALAVEAARRTGAIEPLIASPGAPDAADGVVIEATVRLEARPYALRVWVGHGVTPTRAPEAPVRLDDLGDVTLSLPIVAAASVAPRRETLDLGVGDVWMPGAGWFGDARDARALAGSAVLAAPSSHRGVAVGHSEEGRIVLLGGVVALAPDAPDPRRGDDPSMSEQKDTLDSVLLDSEVVIRVEVGTVSLTAREWAAMRPGDVLETGLRIAEPVVLRIGGREVARGELVSVDGELGVKISELVVPGRSS